LTLPGASGTRRVVRFPIDDLGFALALASLDERQHVGVADRAHGPVEQLGQDARDGLGRVARAPDGLRGLPVEFEMSRVEIQQRAERGRPLPPVSACSASARSVW
jgi:hypothetical protein